VQERTEMGEGRISTLMLTYHSGVLMLKTLRRTGCIRRDLQATGSRAIALSKRGARILPCPATLLA
jgi:hypothetical protein